MYGHWRESSYRIDITNKICNRCRVLKQVTCFDKQKSICKERNSTKVKSEYCPSIISSSVLSSHIKNSHKDIGLTKGIHPIREGTKSLVPQPASQIKEESEYYKYYLLYCILIAKGVDIGKLLED